MPFDIGVLREEGVPALVTWLGHDINVRYLPTNHTSEMQERLVKATPIEVAEAVLAELVCGWDITDNGKPLPLDPPTIKGLPIGLKLAIVQGVVGDLVNPTTPPTSRPSSVPTDTSSSGGGQEERSDDASGRSESPNGSGSVG